MNRTRRYLFSVLILAFAVSGVLLSTPSSAESQLVQAISTIFTTTTTTTTTQTAPASSTTSTSTSTSSTSTSTTATSTSTSWSYTSSTTTTTTNSSTSTSYTATAITSTTSTVTTSTSLTGATTTTITTTSTTTVAPAFPACPVAMVAAGSALEPFANGLRGFRNNQIMRTQVGYDFMVTFNSWYYSWAPSVARLVATNRWFADALRVGLVPLFGILYAADFSYVAVASINPEAGAITAGLVAASLIGLVYVAPLAYLSMRLLRLHRKLGKFRSLHAAPLLGWLGVSATMILAAYLSGSSTLMGLATASLTLSTLSLGCITGTKALGRIQLPTINMPAMIVALKHITRHFPNF